MEPDPPGISLEGELHSGNTQFMSDLTLGGDVKDNQDDENDDDNNREDVEVEPPRERERLEPNWWHTLVAENEVEGIQAQLNKGVKYNEFQLHSRTMIYLMDPETKLFLAADKPKATIQTWDAVAKKLRERIRRALKGNTELGPDPNWWKQLESTEKWNGIVENIREGVKPTDLKIDQGEIEKLLSDERKSYLMQETLDDWQIYLLHPVESRLRRLLQKREYMRNQTENEKSLPEADKKKLKEKRQRQSKESHLRNYVNADPAKRKRRIRMVKEALTRRLARAGEYNRYLIKHREYRAKYSKLPSWIKKCPICEGSVTSNNLSAHVKGHDKFKLFTLPLSLSQRQRVEELTRKQTGPLPSAVIEANKDIAPHLSLAGVVTTTQAHPLTHGRPGTITKAIRGIKSGYRLHPTKLFEKVPHMLRGINIEGLSVERTRAALNMSEEDLHYPCGRIFYSEEGFIAATPDGMLLDKADQNRIGLLEMKNSLRPASKMKYIVKAPSGVQGGSYLKRGPQSNLSGRYMLRRSSPYFTQLLLQFLVSGCDFVRFVNHFQDDTHGSDFELWNEVIERKSVSKQIAEFKAKLYEIYHKKIVSPDDKQQDSSTANTADDKFRPSRKNYVTEPFTGPYLTGADGPIEPVSARKKKSTTSAEQTGPEAGTSMSQTVIQGVQAPKQDEIIDTPSHRTRARTSTVQSKQSTQSMELDENVDDDDPEPVDNDPDWEDFWEDEVYFDDGEYESSDEEDEEMEVDKDAKYELDDDELLELVLKLESSYESMNEENTGEVETPTHPPIATEGGSSTLHPKKKLSTTSIKLQRSLSMTDDLDIQPRGETRKSEENLSSSLTKRFKSGDVTGGSMPSLVDSRRGLIRQSDEELTSPKKRRNSMTTLSSDHGMTDDGGSRTPSVSMYSATIRPPPPLVPKPTSVTVPENSAQKGHSSRSKIPIIPSRSQQVPPAPAMPSGGRGRGRTGPHPGVSAAAGRAGETRMASVETSKIPSRSQQVPPASALPSGGGRGRGQMIPIPSTEQHKNAEKDDSNKKNEPPVEAHASGSQTQPSTTPADMNEESSSDEEPEDNDDHTAAARARSASGNRDHDHFHQETIQEGSGASITTTANGRGHESYLDCIRQTEEAVRKQNQPCIPMRNKKCTIRTKKQDDTAERSTVYEIDPATDEQVKKSITISDRCLSLHAPFKSVEKTAEERGKEQKIHQQLTDKIKNQDMGQDFIAGASGATTGKSERGFHAFVVNKSRQLWRGLVNEYQNSKQQKRAEKEMRKMQKEADLSRRVDSMWRKMKEEMDERSARSQYSNSESLISYYESLEKRNQMNADKRNDGRQTQTADSVSENKFTLSSPFGRTPANQAFSFATRPNACNRTFNNKTVNVSWKSGNFQTYYLKDSVPSVNVTEPVRAPAALMSKVAANSVHQMEHNNNAHQMDHNTYEQEIKRAVAHAGDTAAFLDVSHVKPQVAANSVHQMEHNNNAQLDHNTYGHEIKRAIAYAGDTPAFLDVSHVKPQVLAYINARKKQEHNTRAWA